MPSQCLEIYALWRLSAPLPIFVSPTISRISIRCFVPSIFVGRIIANCVGYAKLAVNGSITLILGTVTHVGFYTSFLLPFFFFFLRRLIYGGVCLCFFNPVCSLDEHFTDFRNVRIKNHMAVVFLFLLTGRVGGCAPFYQNKTKTPKSTVFINEAVGKYNCYPRTRQ